MNLVNTCNCIIQNSYENPKSKPEGTWIGTKSKEIFMQNYFRPLLGKLRAGVIMPTSLSLIVKWSKQAEPGKVRKYRNFIRIFNILNF